MQSRTYKRRPIPRSAFTLLELMLSLSLIVLATALIGSLMQFYSRNFVARGDNIRREQLAQAILHMIADDIRAVVMPQEYDPTVLEKLMGASGSASATAPENSAGGGQLASQAAPATGDSAAPADDLAGTVTTAIPPGIYGDQYSLMVDVSRIPRPDEYVMQQASVVDGFLSDVPGDMKTVTYYVQSSTNMGVDDLMANFVDPSQATGYSSGLVRRQLDRAVTAYAEENGDTTRLQRTGDLLAPEVVAIEFMYYDGVDWLTEWDSSTQSLPWLIEVSLAMQSATASETSQLAAGISISMMSFEDRQAYGVEVYQLIVAIPGAQLRAADATSADQAAGMESLGLQ